MSSYHNTNNEQGVLLFESEKKAQTQEQKILSIFKSFPEIKFTPEEIMNILDEKNVPLTSIRRAISNLADPCKWHVIVKTDEMRIGLYGKMVHTWILKPVV